MSADSPDAAPSKKRWLVPAVALLLSAGGVLAFTQPALLSQVTGGVPAAQAAEPEPVEFGEFAEMPGIVVNPMGTDGRRYLMVKIGAEAEEVGTLERLDEMSPAATDAVIDLLGGLRVEELTDISRRDSLKESIRTRVNDMLGEDGPVTRVYFTQYVLQ